MSNKYLFKNASNEWIFGDVDLSGETPVFKTEIQADAGKCRRYIRTVNGESLVGLQNYENGNFAQIPVVVTELVKNVDGEFYADLAAFRTATADFFFSVTVSGGFMTFPISGGNFIRWGYRNGGWVVDVTLTATGFAGVENTDWEQIGGQIL